MTPAEEHADALQREGGVAYVAPANIATRVLQLQTSVAIETWRCEPDGTLIGLIERSLMSPKAARRLGIQLIQVADLVDI